MATAVLDDWTAVHHSPSSSSPAAATTQSAGAQQKKPRHRHSPEQLAALNELFDKNEHPPLDARTALAERLGMETKTVNAWFQNKRASSKKRTRTLASDQSNGSSLNTPPVSIPAPPPAPSAATTPGALHPDLDDDDQPISTLDHFSPLQKVSQSSDMNPSSNSSSFFAANPDLHYFTSPRESPDPSNMTRKSRNRPNPVQTEELKKLYNITPHPTSEDRQALAERTGMRYQSITNWFQNQRSLAKRRKEDDHTDTSSSNSKSDYPHHGDMRQYSAFPPRPPHHMHRSLAVSDSALPTQSQVHMSPSEAAMLRRSPSVSPSMDDHYARRASMRRSTTPYGGPMQSRPRRSRPEPYQLDALKGLFTRTATPTIEERSALALEIGMDIGKVTNWFRNLRQTARKRNSRHHGAEQVGSGDDDDGDMHDQDDESPQYSSAVSRSGSRAGTPSRSSSSSSSSLMMDGERDIHRMRRHVPHSNLPSDDEYPEVATPENGRSPSPGLDGHRRPPLGKPMHELPLHSHLPMARDSFPPPSSYSHHLYLPPPSYPPHYTQNTHTTMPSKLHPPEPRLPLSRFNSAFTLIDPRWYPKPHAYRDEDPVSCAETAKRFGIKLEDAYLLLDFHRQ
ncbi:hypothetical protein D9611_005085 [Ephemerocybe angulata]|uniref:Homeobox domain-containing protein n=1 Tax=Ephemerocybe angulata TaxID=980116 RepID=A0A8H5BZY2_9AGAR|nr:hypothetical protein D9611_005085 [Tulosesus angulatus]